MNRPNPSSKRRFWTLGFVAFVAVAAAVWLLTRPNSAHAASGAPRSAPAIPVTAGTVEVHDVDIVLRALGTVTPISSAVITSRVAGVLQEIHYTEGQMVKQNDLLAVIDPKPYAAALAQAQGQLTRDQAVLANARIDLERYQTALQEHAIPEQQVATQQAIVGEAEGSVKLDQASVEAAQINLDYTRILSPINGRVGLRTTDLGNNVLANGSTGIVTVTQLQPITVTFTLPQDALAQVAPAMRSGQELRLEAYDRTNPKPLAEGHLLTIDNQVDPATGTFRLKGAFANEDTTLWPGEFVNLRFVVGVRKAALTVPSRAVQRGPNGSYIFVIKPDLSVDIRNVDVVQNDQNIAVIAKGVSAGDRIVVDGQYRLEAGSKVAVQPSPTPTPAGA